MQPTQPKKPRIFQNTSETPLQNPPFYIDLAQDSMELLTLPNPDENHPISPHIKKIEISPKNWPHYIKLTLPPHTCHCAIPIPKIATVFRNFVVIITIIEFSN